MKDTNRATPQGLLEFTLANNLKILIPSEEISYILMPVPSNMSCILSASKVKSHLCIYRVGETYYSFDILVLL